MSGSKGRNTMYGSDREEKNRIEPGTLYLVATPIGNLSDLSERAVKVLSGVDFIAAEDTRNTGKLLSYLSISKPMVSYYQHNRTERGEAICHRLLNGESCALVTDAGTPAISDPGEDLVRLCAENNIKVTCIPGACAAITALALSGIFTGRFAFEGFLSGAKGERKKRLAELASEERTMIFYEAPHHLISTLRDISDALGDRKIALCRELTKINEEIMRTTLNKALERCKEIAPRGEYVIIVEGKSPNEKITENMFWSEMTPVQHVNFYIGTGLDKNSAIKAAAKDRGVPKNEIYKAYLSEA